MAAPAGERGIGNVGNRGGGGSPPSASGGHSAPRGYSGSTHTQKLYWKVTGWAGKEGLHTDC